MLEKTNYESAGGDPLVIEWHVEKHVMFSFEIDADALEKLIPEELTLVEVRPGIALYSVAALQYKAGQFGQDSPRFLELVSVAHVQSDLSVKMPPSRFAMHAISVYSESPDFIQQEGEKLFTPTTFDPSLRFTFTDASDGVEAVDKDGPIVSLRNTHPAPVFQNGEIWGQHYNNTHGLHFGIWQWDGMKFEHQSRGDAAKFHPHPFFKGMDLSRIRGCYRQMMADPGSPATERFYKMHRLR